MKSDKEILTKRAQLGKLCKWSWRRSHIVWT